MNSLLDGKDGSEPTQDDLDNRSTQLNPNHDTYWKDRGEEERPEDWEERAE